MVNLSAFIKLDSRFSKTNFVQEKFLYWNRFTFRFSYGTKFYIRHQNLQKFLLFGLSNKNYIFTFRKKEKKKLCERNVFPRMINK